MKNKKLVFKVAGYLVAVALFVFYLYSLMIAFRPHVSQEYELFYINREVSHYLEEGELKNYTVNKDYFYKADGDYKNMGKGWSYLEDQGTWMIGDETSIWFNVDKKDDVAYSLDIKVLASISQNYKTDVYINDKILGQFTQNKEGVTNIEISNELIQTGLNKIAFKTDGVKPICEIDRNSSDTRSLTYLVEYVRLNEK